MILFFHVAACQDTPAGGDVVKESPLSADSATTETVAQTH